jgi:response regulator of citrate/malate metabolism
MGNAIMAGTDGSTAVGGIGFRAKPNLIKHRLIDHGAETTVAALAQHCGISRITARRLMNGKTVTATTMALVMHYLGSEGDTVESLFELVYPDGEA